MKLKRYLTSQNLTLCEYYSFLTLLKIKDNIDETQINQLLSLQENDEIENKVQKSILTLYQKSQQYYKKIITQARNNQKVDGEGIAQHFVKYYGFLPNQYRHAFIMEYIQAIEVGNIQKENKIGQLLYQKDLWQHKNLTQAETFHLTIEAIQELGALGEKIHMATFIVDELFIF